MAAKPLTSEAIALTEKKMDMTLEDIIKMSKNNTTKPKKQRRAPNKNQNFLKNAAQEKSAKMRRFMDSRSSLRQGVLAQRRSNYQGNHFPLTAEVARKAANAPLRNRVFSNNQTPNWKPRTGAPLAQRRAGNGGFAAKPQPPPQQQRQTVTGIPKLQKPQTLDSLFANLKEERMRFPSRKNNPVPRNRAGPQRPPWARARFGN
ncbi:hypothetical protein UlMin_002478 [Ulmus minor]